MPTTTNNKVEAKPSTDGGDVANPYLNCLEKKVRNLEKRKGKIEQNQEKARKGIKLEKEQENSLQQYDQVTHDLEFARELQKQFLQINGEHEKMAKKQAKREKAERRALEIKRISEIFQLQSLLDLLGGDKVRQDLKTGKHGAVDLTDDNLNQLDELYQAISPSRDDSGEEYPQRLNTAAEHLVNFLDGKDRQVVGTTYKKLKELITLINGCGYFERAHKAETEDNVLESNQETEEFVDTTEEPVNDSETETANGQEGTETPQQQQPQPQQQQPIDLIMGTSGATQSQRDLPTQDVFFAPSSTPYEADPETQFSQPSHTAASRMPDFQSITNNRPFQFIQPSYVMPETANGKPASSCDSGSIHKSNNVPHHQANLETTVQSILTTVEYIRTSFEEVKSTVARLEQNVSIANGKPASSCDSGSIHKSNNVPHHQEFSSNRCSNGNGTNNVANLETTVQSILTTVEYIRTSFEEVKSTVARLEQNVFIAPGSKTWPKFDPDLVRFTGKKFDDSEGVHVYTDGSCPKNGTIDARAGIGVYWGRNDPLNISERLPGRQTNNRAEIHAAVRAVQQAKEKKKIQNLIICTDSEFLICGITKWINGWKRNGWMTIRRTPVINKEDFEKLDKELKGINVRWVFVKGHAGNPGNKVADRFAKKGAKKEL